MLKAKHWETRFESSHTFR